MSRRRSKGQKYEKPPRRAVFGGGRFVAARTSTFDQQAKRITPPELAVIIIISTTSLSLGFPCPCSPLLPAHSSKRIERLSAWHASADAIKASLDEPYSPPSAHRSACPTLFSLRETIKSACKVLDARASPADNKRVCERIDSGSRATRAAHLNSTASAAGRPRRVSQYAGRERERGLCLKNHARKWRSV